MAKTAMSRVALLVLVALSVSCTDTNGRIPLPTTPTPVTPPAPPPAPPPPPPLRGTPFAGPGTYEFVASPVPGRSVQPYTSGSRYVLRDDGTFTFHTPNHGYPGRFTEADGIVTFDFDWNNTRAGARGVFSGDEMTVTYNFDMSMSDFEDGVYVKRQVIATWRD